MFQSNKLEDNPHCTGTTAIDTERKSQAQGSEGSLRVHSLDSHQCHCSNRDRQGMPGNKKRQINYFSRHVNDLSERKGQDSRPDYEKLHRSNFCTRKDIKTNI